MRIEHVAMYVNDLEAARDFFVRYLDGRSDGGYHNTTTGFDPTSSLSRTARAWKS